MIEGPNLVYVKSWRIGKEKVTSGRNLNRRNVFRDVDRDVVLKLFCRIFEGSISKSRETGVREGHLLLDRMPLFPLDTYRTGWHLRHQLGQVERMVRRCPFSVTVPK